jgi:hypothetical protein
MNLPVHAKYLAAKLDGFSQFFERHNHLNRRQMKPGLSLSGGCHEEMAALS